MEFETDPSVHTFTSHSELSRSRREKDASYQARVRDDPATLDDGPGSADTEN